MIVCSMPLEYCEFSPVPDKCKDWCKENEPEAYEDIYENNGQLAEGMGGLSVSDADDATKKAKKNRGGKGIIKKKPQEVGRIVISKVTRNKRKFVTVVEGLKTCDIDVKKAAKLFGSKFACGSSVTGGKTGDEIVIQGDVLYEVADLITETWPDVDENCIEIDEGKKTKR
eukprot:Nk52_evm1s133 gene=Nk52_evmTU1s133